MGVPAYDVVVIGGGTAGLAAATRCAGNGLKTALVERGRLGGECLWTGCVPTKAMLYSAEIRSLMERAEEFGLASCRQAVDWTKVVRAKDEVVARLAEQDTPDALNRAGVTVFSGSARLRSTHEVEVDGAALSARHIVVATGSRQSEPRQIPGLREAGYITHVEAVNLPSLPAAIAIIGAGPVGVEFAQLFARLGARVVLLERSPFILAKEDPEVSQHIARLLEEREGIAIKRRCLVAGVVRRGNRKVLQLRSDDATEEIEVDEVLLATGRTPNLEGMNLSAVGVATGPRGIEVDDHMRATVPDIYACGDVAGKYLFTHVAEYEASIVAHNIAFPERPRPADYKVVPWVIFTDPEVAHMGLTEPEAREAGHDIRVERYSFASSDRAVTIRKTEGFVKVIADARSDEILGALIVSPGAANIIHEYVLAMKARVPLSEIADTIHVYPTLSEALKWTAAKIEEKRAADKKGRPAA